MSHAQVLTVEPEKIDAVTRKIRLTIPSQRIVESKQQKLFELQKKVRVDGFRKNKVPLRVVERIYGQSALADVVDALCWQLWQQTVKDNDLKPLGMPKFSVSAIEKDQPVDFSVDYEVIPEIVFGDYSAIEVDKAIAAVSDEDVDQTIANILENQTQWHQVDRPSVHGDVILADFSYCFTKCPSGNVPPNQQYKDQHIVLSDDRLFLPELLQYLIDVKAGDQVKCSATFPDDFDNPNWRGNTADFVVDVKAVKQSHKPELNADFACRMGISEDNEDPVAAFRGQVRSNLDFELQSAISQSFRDQLLSKVVEKTNIPVPQAMEDYYNTLLRREFAQRFLTQDQLKKYGSTPEDGLDATHFAVRAKHNAEIRMLIDEIERQRDMSVTDEEIRLVAQGMSVQYDDPETFVKQILTDQRSLEQCKRRAVEDKVLRWLESQVQVREVRKTYQQVVNVQEPTEQPVDNARTRKMTTQENTE